MSPDILYELIGLEPYKDYDEIKAKEFEKIIGEKLKNIGEVEYQYLVDNRGDGRRGFIDIMLKISEVEYVAIEIDRKVPREKSKFKVWTTCPSNAFVITRSPFCIYQI